MNKSVPPAAIAAIALVLIVCIGFGIYHAVAPPDFTDTHGGKPYGAHMPPAAAMTPSSPPPAPAGGQP